MPAAPQQASRYRPLQELARGAMGVVYRALDQSTGQEVALKVLLNSDPAEIKRWQQELRAGQALDHPLIARTLDAGANAQGAPWIVQELVPGESLRQKLDREGPLSSSEVMRIGAALAGALEHAHGRGILHRDLKPQNVILRPDGQPVLIDLGLAKITNKDLKASQSLTQTGEIMGTPVFMAPEQAQGDKRAIGPWTDVYGLGATLYMLATNTPPFDGKVGWEVLAKVIEDPPAKPRTLRPEVTQELEEVILRCMEKEPARRYQSAAAVERAMKARQALAKAVSTAPLPVVRTLRPARWPFLAALVFVSLGVLPLHFALKISEHAQGPSFDTQRSRPAPETPTTEAVAPAPAPAPIAEPAPAPIAEPEAEPTPETEPTLARSGPREFLLPGDLAVFAGLVKWRPKLQPRSAHAFFVRGVTRERRGDFAGASADYAQASSLDPGHAGALIGRAKSAGAAGNYSMATADLERALAILPSDHQDRAVCANLLKQAKFFQLYQEGARLGTNGDYAASKAVLDQALEVMPNDADALTLRGTTKSLLGDRAGSFEDYENALRASPGHARALIGRGYGRVERRDYSGAAADFARALKVLPADHPDAARCKAALEKLTVSR